MDDDIKNIIILGTNHIAQESLEKVKQLIEKEKPDIVALELDGKRLYSLLHPKTQKLSFHNMFKVGINGFLFALLGSWASKKLGKIVGVMPGTEMKTAYHLAKKNKLKIALIDQDIEITLKKFSMAFTWKEKWRIIKDIFIGLLHKDKTMEKYQNLDLTKIPSDELIKELISEVKKRYPSIYKVLIEDRNLVMANNLEMIRLSNPGKKILAVVGAGHKEGIEELLDGNRVTYSFKLS